MKLISLLILVIYICALIYYPPARDYTVDVAKWAWKEGRPLAEKGFNMIMSYAVVREKASPQDRVSEDEIKVYEDRIVIERKNVQWSRFTDTNSMDPLLDAGANGLEVTPKNEDEIQLGDVISYKSGDSIIIHSVVEIGNDGEWYAITKGLNNPIKDIEKVRFDQVEGILIGVLY